jgi:hypothetical protein
MGQYIQPDPGVYLFNLNPSLYVELPLTITGGTGIYAGAHGEGVLTTYYDASCFALPSRLAGRTTFALSYG